MITTFDTETHLLSPGCIAPRLVCLSWTDGTDFGLLAREDALDFIGDKLRAQDSVFAGQHVQFDFGVIAAERGDLLDDIFRAYREGRVHCTKIRQQLLDIAQGFLKFHPDPEEHWKQLKSEYSLEALAWRLLRVKLAKEGTWRLRYAELDGVPISEWPSDAVDYAMGDAFVTYDVFKKQEEIAGGEIPNSAEQHKASWALQLMSMWGLRTDPEAVKKLRAQLESEQIEAMSKLRKTDIFRIDGSKNMKVLQARVAAGYAAQGLEPPVTPKNATPSTSAEVLRASKDPDLVVLADSMKGAKLLSTYVPVLERGVRVPVNPNYNTLVETGRTSANSPNIQNPPRKGGVRDCFVPRPGFVFSSVDYDTIELRALAQICLDLFGHSALAEQFKNGEDPHLNLAAGLLGLSREEALSRYRAGDKEIEEYRQLAKIGNYGMPGGMAARTFVEYASGYGVTVDQSLAERLHAAWFRALPEMASYFAYLSSLTNSPDPVLIQIRSNRRRAGITYTSGCNSLFQGLTADGAKDALWELTLECYTDQSSALRGAHPVAFLHDEAILEVPYDPAYPERASNAAKRQTKIMIDVMKRWLPDVPVGASPVLMKRWHKGAKSVSDVNGNLLPVRPVSDGKKTKWVVDE